MKRSLRWLFLGESWFDSLLSDGELGGGGLTETFSGLCESEDSMPEIGLLAEGAGDAIILCSVFALGQNCEFLTAIKEVIRKERRSFFFNR